MLVGRRLAVGGFAEVFLGKYEVSMLAAAADGGGGDMLCLIRPSA